MTTAQYTDIIDMTSSSVFHQGFYDRNTHSVWLVFKNGTVANRYLPAGDEFDLVYSWGSYWNETLKERSGLWHQIGEPVVFEPRQSEEPVEPEVSAEQETFGTDESFAAEQAETSDEAPGRFVGVGFYVSNEVIEDLTLAWSELAYSVSDAASSFVTEAVDAVAGYSDVADTVLGAFRQGMGAGFKAWKAKN